MTPWPDSVALEKLQQIRHEGRPLRLAFLDIDNTLTTEPQEQRQLRQKLEEQGYIITLVTARTSELCLSWKAREKSSVEVQRRPKAKFAADGSHLFREADPASLPGMQGLLDPDLLAPVLGGELLIKQSGGGFIVDHEYARAIPYEPTIWGAYGARLVDQLKVGLETLAPSVLLANYLEGRIGAVPPESWVQVKFSSAAEKESFVATMADLQKRTEAPPGYDPAFFAMIRDTILTDESYPDHDPPSFTVFITHKTVHKLAAVDRVMQVITKELFLPADQFEVLISGDGPSDVRMGLFGALGSRATFLIPGGARLAHYITTNNMSFMGSEFANVPQELVPVAGQAGKNIPGHYRFERDNRTVMIGDQAYPGTKGGATLLRYLETLPIDR